MKKSNLVLCVSGVLVAALGSVTLSAQAWPIIIQPSIVIGTPAIVAPPVYMAPAPVVEYQPAPADVYITAAVPADVVFIGGVTYIWGVDAYGHRVRHFYMNGDHRADVFRRQQELHRVEARNGGHLPPRGETHSEAMAHEQQRMATAGHGGAPGANNHAANHGAPARGGNEHEHEHDH